MRKHKAKTFREVYLEDPSCCGWTAKQNRPGAAKADEVLQVFCPEDE